MKPLIRDFADVGNSFHEHLVFDRQEIKMDSLIFTIFMRHQPPDE